MMNGSDFLDKLEDLDPDLIQAAAQTPAPRTRRVWDSGPWIAAAACLCALFLPWILGRVIRPDLSAGSSARQESSQAFRQPENAHEGDPENSMESPPQTAGGNIGAEEEAAKAGGFPVQEEENSAEKYSDAGRSSWTAATLDEAYQSGFPEGRLPAEEYFSHNTQTQPPLSLANDAVDLALTGETQFTQSEQIKKILPDLEDSRYTGHGPQIFGDFDENEALSRLQIGWTMSQWDDENGFVSQQLTATVSARDPADPDTEAQAKIQGGETHIIRGGILVTALGFTGQERTLSFQRDGMYYRIFAHRSIPDAHIVAVLDWFLGDSFRLELFSRENGQTFPQEDPDSPEDIPSAFPGAYPAMASVRADGLNGEPAPELVYGPAPQPGMGIWMPVSNGTNSFG